MCIISMQLYIGPSRATVVQNRDVCKELRVGMLVAVAGKSFPRVGMVKEVPENPHLHSEADVQWMEQERAAHKSKWHRYFRQSNAVGKIMYNEILLYDFQLTERGALKKKSREYLQEYFK